jgi:CRP-like cAMP-binding protein
MATHLAWHENLRAIHGAELLLRRLKAVGMLSSIEIELVRSIRQRARQVGAGAQVSPEGDGPPQPRLIISGWACRPRVLPDGRCQMLSILLPGDLIGDTGDFRPLALSPVMALTNVRTINAKPIFDAVAAEPKAYRGLALALQRLTRLEEAYLLDHVVRLGRQTALQRLAHCLLELYYRARTIGFVHGNAFTMPLTQELIGDALGLSLVHVNRTLSQLKRDGLISLGAGVLTILDVSKLAYVADYATPDTTVMAQARM